MTSDYVVNLGLRHFHLWKKTKIEIKNPSSRFYPKTIAISRHPSHTIHTNLENDNVRTEEKDRMNATAIESDVKSAFVKELEKRCDSKRSCLGLELDTLIGVNPGLLDIKFDHAEYGEVTATEFLCCRELTSSCRDLLCELIGCGAKTTLKCYQESVEFYSYVECLLLSGYMPLDFNEKGDKFLDCMMQDHSYFKDDSEAQEDILRLLLGDVKPGDQFTFGVLSLSNIERLKDLPQLEAGVTHKESGAFDDILQEYVKNSDGHTTASVET